MPSGNGRPPGGDARPDRGVALQREQVIRKLRDWCADGRLAPGELAGRVEAAQRAQAYEDLRRLTDDLPGRGTATVSGARRGARRLVVGFLGIAGGRFPALRPRVLAVAAFGEVVIDLRQTPLTSYRTEITAVAVAGEVRILVPPGMPVEQGDGVSVLGRTALPEAGAPGPQVPVLRLRSLALLGNVWARTAG